VYGTDIEGLRDLIEQCPELGELVHPSLPYKQCEVVWAARVEMARRVEDVLARRTRALLLNARASIEAAPLVARLMAGELGRDEEWISSEVEAYRELAAGYLLD
jgi:glycerol-3-phosphate dehydrogenase